ncbi:gas vesicle synthesis family protein [Haloprofundus marisrubri]|uniref:Gas vesicle synthesis family protein n=1 Tax=Haloprofundus marisrubri TaxID=1514971 RepID=A0A0W1RC56_9EURY|nr:gas vesicle protein [Haloprofundus marisrubri]KTG10950.1 gas vesicle synthesis family protein [Haloprofundus marisrubri]
MPELDPTEHTVDELEDELQEIDDQATLRDAYEAEQSGEDRSSAKEAIRRRLDEVAEGEPQPEADGSGDEDEDESDENDSSNQSETADIMSVKESVRNVATELIGHELDGVTELRRVDDGWEGVVEVIERPSVPDTQDILGAYEIQLDEGGTVTGYRRVDRYRRADTDREEHV